MTVQSKLKVRKVLTALTGIASLYFAFIHKVYKKGLLVLFFLFHILFFQFPSLDSLLFILNSLSLFFNQSLENVTFFSL